MKETAQKVTRTFVHVHEHVFEAWKLDAEVVVVIVLVGHGVVIGEEGELH